MLMKKYAYLLALNLIAFGAGAQRFADVQTRLTSPLNGSTVITGQPTTLSFTVSNKGPEDLHGTDSLAVYFIADNDTVLHASPQGLFEVCAVYRYDAPCCRFHSPQPHHDL